MSSSKESHVKRARSAPITGTNVCRSDWRTKLAHDLHIQCRNVLLNLSLNVTSVFQVDTLQGSLSLLCQITWQNYFIG